MKLAEVDRRIRSQKFRRDIERAGTWDDKEIKKSLLPLGYVHMCREMVVETLGASNEEYLRYAENRLSFDRTWSTSFESNARVTSTMLR